MSRRYHMGRSDRYVSVLAASNLSNYESTGDVKNSAGSPMVRVGQVLLQKSRDSRDY